MNGSVQGVLQKLREGLTQIYGSRLQGLMVYGSFAQGTERPGSDLDVAMILDEFDRPWPEIQRTGEVVARLSLECGRTISLIPVRSRDWEKGERLLLRNIRREGVAVP